MPRSNPDPVDAVVVLGAALTEAGAPTPALDRRVRHGARLLQEFPQAMLVLSGRGQGSRTEADAMREIALGLGVAPERIVLEAESIRTLENAAFTARLLAARGWTRAVVVSDPHHLPRALWCFRRFGVAPSGRAVPDASGWPSWPRVAGAWIREAVAFLWYLRLLPRWKKERGW